MLNREIPHVTGPRYDDNGLKVADGLLDWAGIYYPGYTPNDIQRYYNRGQFIDRACNLIAMDSTLHPETLAKAEREGWLGFLDAYREFVTREQFVLADCAVHVTNRIERYQGTFDQRGTLRNEPVLLDLKTGTAPVWTGLQLALYALALDHGLARVLVRAAVELHADGTYALIPYTDFKEFDKARLLARAYHVAQGYL